jgi:uncharacterized protein (UPF0332 family)
MNTFDESQRNSIAALRLERANETLTAAKANIEMEFWRTAANRLYYACFYGVSALLAKYGVDAQTHSGVIRMLGEHFVKRNIISKERSHFYGKLFELRQDGDYDDYVVIEPNVIKSYVLPAEEFIAEIASLIER